MLNKLEEIKIAGNYAVNLTYGEDIGCDDLDVPIQERKIIVIMTPVGFCGSKRKMFIGNVKSFLEFDVKTEPKEISNPPLREEYKDDGFYIWGAD